MFCTVCGQWNCDGQLKIQVSGTQRCPFHGSSVSATEKAVAFPWFSVLLISQKTGKGKRSKRDGGFARRMMAYAGWDLVGCWLGLDDLFVLSADLFQRDMVMGFMEMKRFPCNHCSPLTSCLVRGKSSVSHLVECR